MHSSATVCRVLLQFSLLSSSALQSVNIPDALCHQDEDCPEGQAVVAGNGKERGPSPVLLLAEAGSFRDISRVTTPEIFDFRQQQSFSFR